MNARVRVTLWLLVICCGTLRCVWSTYDVGRPLVVEAVPSEGTRLQAIAAVIPNANVYDLKESLALTRSARNLFDIHTYNDVIIEVPLRDLGRALDRVPQNPFAWVQLGAYLALMQNATSAWNANQRGLELIEMLCKDNSCPDDLKQLRATATINAAIYSISTDNGLAAEMTLKSANVGELSPFHQLAYHWTLVQALVQENDTNVGIWLDAAAKLDENTFDNRRKRDYPQYFGKRRQARQLYLQGSVCAKAGDLTCAIEKFEGATKIDGSYWDASVALANAHFQQQDYDAAITILEKLHAAALKRNVARAERIDFNLANSYSARYEVTHDAANLEIAIDRYEDAVAIYAERISTVRIQLTTMGHDVKDSDVAEFLYTCAQEAPSVYADALNNLGHSYILMAERKHGKDAEKLRRKAESAWRDALQDEQWRDRSLAHANLVTYYIEERRWSEALNEANLGLEADPFNIAPINALLEAIMGDTMSGQERSDVIYRLAEIIGANRGNYAETIREEWRKTLNSALDAMPATSDVWRARVSTAGIHSPAEMYDVLKAVSKEHRDWAWVKVGIAQHTLSQGSGDAAAVDYIKMAVARAPADTILTDEELAELYRAIAISHLESGDFKNARLDLERAVTFSPNRDVMIRIAEAVDHGLRSAGLPRVGSIAVQPFNSVIGPDLGDAFSDTLGVCFERAGLRVVQIPDYSAAVPRFTSAVPADAARLLRAGAILSGSVSVGVAKVQIDARLIDAVTGSVMWENAYRLPMPINSAENVVIKEILAAIGIEPTPDATVERAFTPDGGAYLDYLLARQRLLTASGGAEMQNAVDLLEAATRLDSDFAAAYSAKAMAYYGLANIYQQPQVVMSKALIAAERAFSLATTSAESVLAKALLDAWYVWDLDAADAEFQRARELAPRNANIRRLYGSYLLARGSFHEALLENQQAEDLAPISPYAVLGVGKAHFYLREFDEARAEAEKALELRPGMYEAYELLAWSYTAEERYEAALEAAEWAVEQSNGLPHLRAHVGLLHALRGERAMAEAILIDLETKSVSYVTPVVLARVYSALGDEQKALQHLKTALDARSESIVWLKVDPWLQKLHENPEFNDLLDKVKPWQGGPLH